MTGLFGGLDLGTPATRNESALRRELELRRKLALTDARWADYHYKGGGDFFLQHGRFYAGRQIPERYEHLIGEEMVCFRNAAQAALAEPSLRYCEGCYWTGFGFAAAHAWCVDPDGLLVEVTMPTDPAALTRAKSARLHLPFLPPEHWGYWGVLLRPELALAHFERFPTSSAPMFDRSPGEMTGAAAAIDVSSPHDFPVLKVPYDPQRTTLP